MREKISAAFIFHDTDYYSGATRSLVDMMENLDRERIEIYAVVPINRRKDSLSFYLDKHDIPIIYSLYYGNTYKLREGGWKTISEYPKCCLRKLVTDISGLYLAHRVKKNGIGIIYTNTSTLYIGVIAKLFKKQVRHIWHIREFSEEGQGLGIFGGRKKFYKMMNKYTDDVILISKSVAEKYTPHIRESIVHIIYDDISKQYIQSDFDEYRFGMPLHILICGTIQPSKGQMQAVMAAHQLVLKKLPVHLYVAGASSDSKYYDDICRYVSENHLESYISFMGKVTDMNALRKETKFSIITSNFEAFGRVTIESMLSGHYVVGARCGATEELIEDNVTGRLYRYGDIDELVQILVSAYHDAEAVNRVRRNGYEYALQFAEGRCAKAVEKILLKDCGFD